MWEVEKILSRKTSLLFYLRLNEIILISNLSKMDHLILSHIVKTRIFDSTFSDYVSLTKFQLTPDFFSLSGNLLFDKEIVYENGRSESGILLRRQKEGYWVDIYDNGSVREGGIYLHGFKEGWWITYDSDENKFEEGPYIHGKQNGEWTRYLSTDQSVKEIGTYVNNFMEGDWYLVVNGTNI